MVIFPVNSVLFLPYSFPIKTSQMRLRSRWGRVPQSSRKVRSIRSHREEFGWRFLDHLKDNIWIIYGYIYIWIIYRMPSTRPGELTFCHGKGKFCHQKMGYPTWWTFTKSNGKIHHAINGKIHYFDWAIFNSLLYVHQRVKVFWLVVWNMSFIFPYVGNFIIPTDYDFSEGLTPPTSLGYEWQRWYKWFDISH